MAEYGSKEALWDLANRVAAWRDEPHDDHLRRLGIDPDAFRDFLTEDALDTISNAYQGVVPAVLPVEALGAMLCAHAHVYVLLGWQLARGEWVRGELPDA